MPELLPSDRLRPCLLDRLTDEAPGKRTESREKRVISMQRYRQAVLRDLGWLLNTSNREGIEDLSEFPEVERSVLNFGIPDLCGVPVSKVDPREICRRIGRAIQWCEPRLIPSTLKITPIVNAERMSRNALSFRIEGELWAEPFNELLYIRTNVDLETGDFETTEVKK